MSPAHIGMEGLGWPQWRRQHLMQVGLNGVLRHSGSLPFHDEEVIPDPLLFPERKSSARERKPSASSHRSNNNVGLERKSIHNLVAMPITGCKSSDIPCKSNDYDGVPPPPPPPSNPPSTPAIFLQSPTVRKKSHMSLREKGSLTLLRERNSLRADTMSNIVTTIVTSNPLLDKRV